MIRRMLDVLVCPFDKESELELFEFKTRPIKNIVHNEKQKMEIESNNNKVINPISNSNNDDGDIIEDGILFCNICLRFYPIVEEIPIILPDELRDKNNDLEILKKWSNLLPDKVIKKSIPWHL